MFERIKRLFLPLDRRFHLAFTNFNQRTRVPVLWLFGKTQTGKTSIIKYLTGADEIEIGHGFKPCTRYSREYHFPTPEAPLLTFLDTRGLDEPGYDPSEDIATFHARADLVVVTTKALDHAQENVLKHLRTIRRDRPPRPILLALTCLHEAYPQQQHPEPYPFDVALESPAIPDDLRRSLMELRRRFTGLFDTATAIDLTRPEDAFIDPNYGGDRLKEAMLELLPAAYRQTLLTLDAATRELRDLFGRRAIPYIGGYSTLAATAGALPVPFVDLLVLPAIQTQMIYHLARLYGQPLSGQRFMELAGTLGLSIMVRQGIREMAKAIPYVGSVTAAALAGASTFALGKAFCFYYRAVHQGHVPQADELRHYFHQQLSEAEKIWNPS
jgi:uncharacterized protein (DUF697 family)